MKRTELPIVSPCGADWQGMKPQDIARRFCGACNKHVHDLSQMTQVEARRLLAAPATEGLCVRYWHDEKGDIRFAPETANLVPASRLSPMKRLLAAATLAAAPLSLAACVGEPMPPRQPLMGAVTMGGAPVPPPSAPPAPSTSASAAPASPFATPPLPAAAPR
jgi:hypothetical protein